MFIAFSQLFASALTNFQEAFAVSIKACVVTLFAQAFLNIKLRVDIISCNDLVALFEELFFSNIRYADPVPVFPIQSPQLTSLQWLQDDDAVLCITGIATPKPLVRYLRQYTTNIKVIHFDDHHEFTRRDFSGIFKVVKEMAGKRKFIITTEKDAVRIMNNPYFPPTKRNSIYYIPMRVGFLESEGGNSFVEELISLIDKQKEENNLTTINDNQ